MFSPKTVSLTFIIFLFQILFSISLAAVPDSATFNYVNKGYLGDVFSDIEYHATFRILPIGPYPFPFELCFYNTTPYTYYLGLSVHTTGGANTVSRWVFDFNRGNPVGENATFSLGKDGNLVLEDANGSVAWQSGTANKGVTGFQILSTGNMVLHDAKGKFIWQSFDHPTDTLLVDQSFRVGSKLVSRTSPQQNTNGPYSLVLGKKGFVMYYQNKSTPKPELYYNSSNWLYIHGDESFESVNLSLSDAIRLEYKTVESSYQGNMFLGRVGTGATRSYLRLGVDGTLKAYTFAYTYNPEILYETWAVTFDLFSSSDAETCQLPEKCGKFGLCDKGQCVACPSPIGLLGWSEECREPKLSASSCDAKKVKYYKIVGVDHFVTKYTNGDGPMKGGDCSKKCTLDCKCAGYFYNKGSSMCWIAYDLKTLTKVEDNKHLAFIKT